jgi:tetratricopeptide (TPR) repeat protein
MSEFNLNDNISIRGRTLHLQTQTVKEAGKIILTLFDGGRVLKKEEKPYDNSLSDKDLESYVEKAHQTIIEEVEFLYAISARVKTVRHPLSLNKLGFQFLKWNLLDEAISELELAIQYDKKMGDAYRNLGNAYLKRGGIEEAVSVLERGVEEVPEYADLWNLLGKAYYKVKRYDKALDALERALEINPSYDEAHFYTALVLLQIVDEDFHKEGMPDHETMKNDARDHLNRAAAISRRFKIPDIEEALRKLHNEDIQTANRLLKNLERKIPRIIDLDFHDSFYLNYLYGEKGRQKKAVGDYIYQLEKVLSDHPDYPDIHNFLGIAFLMQCRNLFNRSLHHFQEAIRLNSKFKKAKDNLKLARNEGKGLMLLLRALLK